MKKYLLPESGQFYKANLHAHTDMSDGHQTPEGVKELYQKMGYSIVAYTDHNVFVDRSHLCDDQFLALNGTELDINGRNFGRGWVDMESCHINFIALEPDNLTVPFFHRTKYLRKNASKYVHLMKIDDTLPDYDRFYTPECINEMFMGGRRSGFFTVYNHPCGSLELYPTYIRYNYMHAMEMYNGRFEYNPTVYDDMLRAGKIIYCVGGDDNHSDEGSGHSWTMIKAENLDYRTVTNALMDGHFYSSQGPEIYDLYMEDGVMHVKTSDAQAIHFTTAARGKGQKSAFDPNGGYINEAEFAVLPECVYVRVTVVGPNGKTASTNAYRSIDLLKK